MMLENRRRQTMRGIAFTALLALIAVTLAGQGIMGTADPALLTYSTLPRIAAALIAGFSLGLGGAVFQRIFSNPLAEPGLLGISGGSALALAASLVFAPSLWSYGYQLVAVAGSSLALLIVLTVAWGPRLSSPTLILAGVMVNLYCSAAYAVLVLFNHDFLTNLLSWQAGSLQQSGWGPSMRLLALTTATSLPLLLLERPLRLLSLGDEGARSLGVSVRAIKLLLLAGASLLAATVTAEFGQIGFIGLAAPALARTIWRQSQPGLLKAAITGALLLLATDQIMRLLSAIAGDLPVGAAAGLLTGPLLLVLARRERLTASGFPAVLPSANRRRRGSPLLTLFAIVLAAAFAFGLVYGRAPGGWSSLTQADLALTLRWRLPSLLASAGAGLCLALAGFLLQRLLRNPLASPDLLGIGHGAGLALAISFIVLPAAGLATKFAITTVAAVVTLLAILMLGWRSRFEPSRMLLLGVGLSSTANALLVLTLAVGGQRGAALLGWFSGMTGGVSLDQAVAVSLIGLLCLIACVLMHRQVDMIGLGDPTARSIGVSIRKTRSLGLGIAAIATAAGTVVVGPMSFIGLMVPHFAAALGFRGTAATGIACGLIGALLMVIAEWLSRTLAWPWPLSPGLIAAMVGGPWFLWQIRRQAGTPA